MNTDGGSEPLKPGMKLFRLTLPWYRSPGSGEIPDVRPDGAP